MTSHRIRLALVPVAVVALALGLTACAPPANEWRWKDADAARASDDGYRIPGLVPDDSTKVRLRANLQAQGAWVAWRSEGGITADYCHEGRIDAPPSTPASWWPDTTPNRGWTCGWWIVFHDDDRYWAADGRG